MAFVIGTGAKIKRAGNATPATIAEGECPEALDNDGRLMKAFEQSAETAVSLESHNRAAAEVAYQKLARVDSEGARRKGDTPRRVDHRKLPSGIRTSHEALKCPGLRV